MKNVLLSAYACAPDSGSEEENGWNYATLLSAGGYRIHCLTKHQWQTIVDPILAAGAFPNLTMHYVPIPAWVDKFCEKGLIGMYFHYLYWQWQAYRLGRRLDRKHRFDLVHHVTYGSIQLGSFLYKIGKPFIFGPVGGGQRAPQALKQYFGSYWSREWMRDYVSVLLQYLNPGYFRNLKTADRVVVTNRDTFNLAKRFRAPETIDFMLDAGLSASFVPAEPLERQPGPTLKLLWVGRLMPRKALELTIHALSKVAPELPVTLTVVGGKGEMADLVPTYIERYGVASRVNWVGHVSYQEVKEFYKGSDVFFFTSLRDSCPKQLLEGMTYSLPVVTLDLHGQAELVQPDRGIKVAADGQDSEAVAAALARAVEWMVHHPAERLAMGRAAYEFARTQVWDAKIRMFVDEWYPATMGEFVAESVSVAKE